jgi:hypothetical protein
MAMATPIQVSLQPKQGRAFLSKATEILYGGAAGGGKSHLLRILAIAVAYDVPSAQVYLFRRESVDLIKNHLNGPTGFYVMLAPLIKSGHVRITTAPQVVISFWHGAKIYLAHCKNENDVYGYQGAEMTLLLIDELTHFTDGIYRFLRGRLRLGGLDLPDRWRGKLPKIVCGSNPGNIGHQFVKGMFIDGRQPYAIEKMKKSEGGMLRQFIPALLSDNPILLKNDPEYEDRLEGLGAPELVRAMKEGDWDIVAGAALEKLTRQTHAVRPFKIPGHWTKFTSMDWGTAKPFSVGWYAVVEGDTLIRGRGGDPDVYLPDGALVRYRELYGWNGKPDEGCRKESYEVATEVLEIERQADESMDYRIGDSAMWAQTDGPSPQERMYNATDGRFVMRQSEKDRTMNYQEVRARIAGEDDRPMLYVTLNCQHFWRTVPSLQLDQTNPEKGPDTKQEDHVYDDLSYACRSRPFRTTRGDRVMQAYKKAKKAAGEGGSKDPYRIRK